MGGPLEQQLNYPAVKEKLDKIVSNGESLRQNFRAMDVLIQNSVGEGGVAWTGRSASGYANSWDELREEIPKFIDAIDKQVENIDAVLLLTSKTDTTSSGTVSED
jgi:uncharacterized protein YukE